MKKFFTAVLLLLVIAVTFSIIILASLARGSENNFFNAKYRPDFARYGWVRNLLNLHSAGDARADYISSQKGIIIEADEMKGLQIPQSALDLLKQNISNVTGRQVSVVLSNSDIPYTDSVDDNQIASIANQYRNFHSTAASSVLYLLYLNRYAGGDSRLGSTYRDDGIVLFEKALEEFSQNNPASFSDNVESTALHEFGHQVGLDHNQIPGCLMQAYADDFDLFYGGQNGVITDFCEYEKTQIKNLSGR